MFFKTIIIKKKGDKIEENHYIFITDGIIFNWSYCLCR
jgi:hypothetical protein